MEQMQQGLAEIFVDNGMVFFASPMDDLPLAPYWKTFMAIGYSVADGGEVRRDENEDRNWAFFNKDDELLGIQMVDPVDKESGAPREAVLDWLRAFMEEHQVVVFVEAMKSAHAQHDGERHDEGPSDGPEITFLGDTPVFQIVEGEQAE